MIHMSSIFLLISGSIYSLQKTEKTFYRTSIAVGVRNVVMETELQNICERVSLKEQRCNFLRKFLFSLELSGHTVVQFGTERLHPRESRPLINLGAKQDKKKTCSTRVPTDNTEPKKITISEGFGDDYRKGVSINKTLNLYCSLF